MNTEGTNIMISRFNQVLFVGPQYKNHRGGIGAVIATYALNIDAFKFIATYDGKLNAIENCIFFAKAYLKIFFRLLTDRDIKIVHIHGSSKGSFYRKYLVFLTAKFVFNKKVVYHLHGSEFHIFQEKSGQFTKLIIKHLAEKTDTFVCLSQWWFGYLSNIFNIKKLYIVNNPIDPARFTNHRLEKNKLELKLLFLGRIGERKGIFDLLKVLINNKEIWRRNIKLLIGGDGEIERVQAIIDSDKLEGVVEYVGWVDGQKKWELLTQCDVLVLPSYNEGLPISILEAMSYGKAIVATTVGGIPEVVINGENGYLIEPGDMAALETSIQTMINNPDLVNQMGEKSIHRVEPYMINNVIKQLEIIYTDEL